MNHVIEVSGDRCGDAVGFSLSTRRQCNGRRQAERDRQKIAAIPASASILPRSWHWARAAPPTVAARTRIVSAAGIRLDHRKSVTKLSKGYFATTFLSSSLTCPATQSGLFGAFIPFMGFASSAVCFNGRATLGERWPFRLRATAALIRITWRDRRRDKTTARDFTRRRGPQGGELRLASAHLVLNFRDAPPSRGAPANATPRRFPLRLITRNLSSGI